MFFYLSLREKESPKKRNFTRKTYSNVLSARPFPYGVGSLRIYVRTFVQTAIFLANKITLKQA